jgi:hypothetical protein
VREDYAILTRHLSCRQGTQGILDAASNAALDNEFGTHKDVDVVTQILERGDLRESEVRTLWKIPMASDGLKLTCNPRLRSVKQTRTSWMALLSLTDLNRLHDCQSCEPDTVDDCVNEKATETFWGYQSIFTAASRAYTVWEDSRRL